MATTRTLHPNRSRHWETDKNQSGRSSWKLRNEIYAERYEGMESQNEMHQKSGNEEASGTNEEVKQKSGGTINVETVEQRPAPFSEFDPFRSTRISTLNSETQAFLSELGSEVTGFENLDENELRSLQKDAEERARWSQARSDAFSGILRLGVKTPGRGERLL